jgi:hypothetical protein
LEKDNGVGKCKNLSGKLFLRLALLLPQSRTALAAAALVIWCACVPVEAFEVPPGKVLGFGFVWIEGRTPPVIFPMNSIDATQLLVQVDDSSVTISDVAVDTRGDLIVWFSNGLMRVDHETGAMTRVNMIPDGINSMTGKPLV